MIKNESHVPDKNNEVFLFLLHLIVNVRARQRKNRNKENRMEWEFLKHVHK